MNSGFRSKLISQSRLPPIYSCHHPIEMRVTRTQYRSSTTSTQCFQQRMKLASKQIPSGECIQKMEELRFLIHHSSLLLVEYSSILPCLPHDPHRCISEIKKDEANKYQIYYCSYTASIRKSMNACSGHYPSKSHYYLYQGPYQILVVVIFYSSITPKVL